jgi:hypothetical protein
LRFGGNLLSQPLAVSGTLTVLGDDLHKGYGTFNDDDEAGYRSAIVNVAFTRTARPPSQCRDPRQCRHGPNR